MSNLYTMRHKREKSGISVLVLTLNEEVNLPSCLDSLSWSDDVVVLDSFSTDATEKIARQRGARFFQHQFTGFGDQRNWAFDKIKFKNQWLLILDADERVPHELAAEMQSSVAQAPETLSAMRVRRRFYLWKRWLKHSSLYPTWVVRLIRIGKVRYINRGHAETQVVEGTTAPLENDLIDENSKGMHDWWSRQNDYSTKEALYELSQASLPLRALFQRDPLRRREALKGLARRLPLRPVFYFFYCYIVRAGFRDGSQGLKFALMKAMYMQMIQFKKYEFERYGAPKPAAKEKARRKQAA